MEDGPSNPSNGREYPVGGPICPVQGLARSAWWTRKNPSAPSVNPSKRRTDRSPTLHAELSQRESRGRTRLWMHDNFGIHRHWLTIRQRWSADDLQTICRSSADVFNGLLNLKFCIKFKTAPNENFYFSFSVPLYSITNPHFQYAYPAALNLEFCDSFQEDTYSIFGDAFPRRRNAAWYFKFLGHLFAFLKIRLAIRFSWVSNPCYKIEFLTNLCALVYFEFRSQLLGLLNWGPSGVIWDFVFSTFRTFEKSVKSYIEKYAQFPILNQMRSNMEQLSLCDPGLEVSHPQSTRGQGKGMSVLKNLSPRSWLACPAKSVTKYPSRFLGTFLIPCLSRDRKVGYLKQTGRESSARDASLESSPRVGLFPAHACCALVY